MINNLCSLSNLAQKLGCRKSKLAFYTSIGILMPQCKVGNLYVYDYDQAMAILEKVNNLQKEGIQLKEILTIIKDDVESDKERKQEEKKNS